jgi:hypothetical protein
LEGLGGAGGMQGGMYPSKRGSMFWNTGLVSPTRTCQNAVELSLGRTPMLGKRVQFDDETWSTFDQLTEDRTQNFPELADNDSGNTSIEYGLIAAGIAIGITMAVSS